MAHDDVVGHCHADLAQHLGAFGQLIDRLLPFGEVFVEKQVELLEVGPATC